jgi:hypothetical protein
MSVPAVPRVERPAMADDGGWSRRPLRTPARDAGVGLVTRDEVLVTPERAFGIIERDDEFAQRATRWSWLT